MPSSTSSSKHPALFCAKLLVGSCALLILGFDFSNNYLLRTPLQISARWQPRRSRLVIPLFLARQPHLQTQVSHVHSSVESVCILSASGRTG
jgi:hypothetical protein